MGSKGDGVNIWDLAVAESKRKLRESDHAMHSEEPFEQTLVVIGGAQSLEDTNEVFESPAVRTHKLQVDEGKSLMIARFMDRDESNIKPTTALDYSYTRRAKPSGMTHVKDVGHIYEIGGGISMTQLMNVVISQETIRKVSVLLVLDLSKPNELWGIQEKLLSELRTQVNNIIDEIAKTDQQRAADLRAKATKVIEQKSKDKKFVQPFPFDVAIVGSKYDLFQSLDPEKKKMICRTLRFIANSNGASLYFLSIKGESLTTRLRAILNSLTFKSYNLSKSVCFDHNRVISIPFGEDSFEQIGLPATGHNTIYSTAGSPIDLWKSAYASLFPPQRPNSKKANIDPIRDPQFAEEIVDSMRSQKNEELERFRKLHERKTREMELAKGSLH